MNGFIKLSSPSTKEFWKIPVLFEDESLLVLDKPENLLTSPDRLAPDRPSLIKLLHAAVADQKSCVTERNITYLMNAHRLDYEATGTLFLAKSKSVLVSLANLFGSEKPLRTYLALVKGSPRQDQFIVDAAIGQDMKFPDRMRIHLQKGKKTKTQFEVVERFQKFTLLKAMPLTDRRHQVRVHLRHAGFPVCGDDIYGGRPLMLSSLKPHYRLKPNRIERPLIGSTALHAQSVALTHPVTGQPLLVESPTPKYMQVALKYLRQYASVGGAPDDLATEV